MNHIFHISFLLEHVYIYIVSYGPLVYWKWRKRDVKGRRKEREEKRKERG